MNTNSIEEHRKYWQTIAVDNGWMTGDKLYVQVWVDKAGVITDSVSFRGLTHDIIVREGQL